MFIPLGTAGLVSCFLVVGCTTGVPSGQVTGKVTFEGKAVAEGIVSFLSDAGAGDEAHIGVDGTYKVPRPLPTGEYKVTVHPLVVQEKDPKSGVEVGVPKPAPDIPEKYRTIGSTDLKAKVEAGNNTINFELKK